MILLNQILKYNLDYLSQDGQGISEACLSCINFGVAKLSANLTKLHTHIPS